MGCAARRGDGPWCVDDSDGQASATGVELPGGTGGAKVVTCNGPGTPYRDVLATRENPDRPILAPSPDCGWVWKSSSAGLLDEKLEVTAVVYDLSWTVSGAPGGGTLPTSNGATSVCRVQVGEVQALNVRY